MPFEFLDPGRLADALLQLHLLVIEPAEQSIWNAPTYRFGIELTGTGERVGHINLRIGQSHLLTHYAGQIGYGVDEPHRGNGYARRACRLLLPFAAEHGMHTVWITTTPDNIASRRTLEHLGADYVETVTAPDDYPLPKGVTREKCRYRIETRKEIL